ncbi:UbiA family prenyltransferase, partial [Natronolimnohabitans sp. A-GB9]|uniref:UbiA family prenyltransferase n=1 Tax=Natronolimnohabitans sp. A-GB9 TaxID=3069757 RepID=UPI0027B36BF9
MLRSNISTVYNQIAYWRVFPAIYAAAVTVAGSLLLDVFSPITIFIAFFTTLSIYNINSLYDVDEDKINNPNNADFALQNRRLVTTLVVISSVVAICLSVFGGIYTPFVVLLCLVSGILYSAKKYRIKNILLLNTVLVAVTLSVIATVIPVTFTGESNSTKLFIIFFYFIVKFAITVEICNIPDIDGDKRTGVTTLPIVLGVSKTKWLLYGLEIGSFGFLIGSVLFGHISAAVLVVFGIPMGYSLWTIYIT